MIHKAGLKMGPIICHGEGEWEGLERPTIMTNKPGSTMLYS